MHLNSHTPHGYKLEEHDLVTLGVAAPLVALSIAMLFLPGLLHPGESAAPQPATPVETETMPYALRLTPPLSASALDTAATESAAA